MKPMRNYSMFLQYNTTVLQQFGVSAPVIWNDNFTDATIITANSHANISLCPNTQLNVNIDAKGSKVNIVKLLAAFSLTVTI